MAVIVLPRMRSGSLKIKPTRNQPLKREPKIPDVAEALGVHTMGLREFYDASGGLTHSAYPIQPAF